MKSVNITLTDEIVDLLEIVAAGAPRSLVVERYLWEHPTIKKAAKREQIKRVDRPRSGPK